MYLTRHIKEKKYYALKMINMEGITTPEKRTCEKEIALMKSLSHPNIIGYKVCKYCIFSFRKAF